MRRITALLGLIALLVGSIAPLAAALDYDPDQARPWVGQEIVDDGDQDPWGEIHAPAVPGGNGWLTLIVINVVYKLWSPDREYRAAAAPSDDTKQNTTLTVNK